MVMRRDNLSHVVVHQLARLLYWISLLLLLAGMWILIDPLHRKTEATLHIYITLIAFEMYMWLLLLLARWQFSKQLVTDTVRGGLFATVLTGIFFIALNELHMAAVNAAYFLSILAVGLAIAKLYLARRWLALNLPKPLLVVCSLWLAALALVPNLLRFYTLEKETQHGVAFVLFWLLAIFIMLHIPLLRWQKRVGCNADVSPLRQWWLGWFLAGTLCFLVLVQLYASMWGLYVDWAAWYFSPVGLAAAMLVICLSIVTGRQYRPAWLFLLMAIGYTLIASGAKAPPELITFMKSSGDSSWRIFTEAKLFLLEPLYANGCFLTLLFAFAGWMVGQTWLFFFAGGLPVTAGLSELAQLLMRWRHGKGTSLLLGAFVVLALAAGLQWWQEKIRRLPKSEQADDDLIDYNKMSDETGNDGI